MSLEWTRAALEPRLNERFLVFPSGTQDQEGLELTLVQVDESKQGRLETLSLLFKGPRERVLPHDTHGMRHPALGSLDVFLGPVQSDKTDGVYYQAVFNRIVA